MDKPYIYCLTCKRWCYATEKIHCWICPVCRTILTYKEKEMTPGRYAEMETLICPHCNEYALRNPDADMVHNSIVYRCWKCTKCYDIFWTREEGVAS